MPEYVVDFKGVPTRQLKDLSFEEYLAHLWGVPIYEEIVRCRDCDLSQKEGTRCLLFAGWEPIEGSDEYELVSAEVEPDGFCKWGCSRTE